MVDENIDKNEVEDRPLPPKVDDEVVDMDEVDEEELEEVEGEETEDK